MWLFYGNPNERCYFVKSMIKSYRSYTMHVYTQRTISPEWKNRVKTKQLNTGVDLRSLEFWVSSRVFHLWIYVYCTCRFMRKWTINMRAGVCFHASGVQEDQFVPIDVVLPSTCEANGGGRGRRVRREWGEWRALNGCDANGTRGHRNQFTLLKQMRAAQPLP